MAHFYGEVSGRAQTAATRCGTKKTGLQAHIRGWHVGVRVEADHANDQDILTISVTHGSGSSQPDKLIGHVWNTKAGPVFMPTSLEPRPSKSKRRKA